MSQPGRLSNVFCSGLFLMFYDPLFYFYKTRGVSGQCLPKLASTGTVSVQEQTTFNHVSSVHTCYYWSLLLFVQPNVKSLARLTYLANSAESDSDVTCHIFVVNEYTRHQKIIPAIKTFRGSSLT